MGIAPIGTERLAAASAVDGPVVLGDEGQGSAVVLGDDGRDLPRGGVAAPAGRGAGPVGAGVTITGVTATAIRSANLPGIGPAAPTPVTAAGCGPAVAVVGVGPVDVAAPADVAAAATVMAPATVTAPDGAAAPADVAVPATVAAESGAAAPAGACVPVVAARAASRGNAPRMAAARPVTMRTPRPRPGVDRAHDLDAVDRRGEASAVEMPPSGDVRVDEAAGPTPPARDADPGLPESLIGEPNVDQPDADRPVAGEPVADEPDAAEPDAGEDVVLEAPGLDWPWPLRMVNPVRSHGWGAKGGLAGVQRRPAGHRPEAELWVGAHPVASSALLDLDGHEIPLLDAIEADPAGVLGRTHRNRFGARLPFLLKVMAVDRALAVQVHPARRHAAEGFARQEAAGVPLRGPARIFVDPHAKPELIVALTPFDALVGLRDPRHAADLLDLLDVAPLVPLRRALATAAAQVHGPARDGTLDALICLASWPFRQRAVLAAGVCDAARTALVNPVTAHHPDTRAALEWVIRLADLHPGDPMVLAPLLLEFVHLEPGETVFVPPGVLHTYLHGVALEAAAASANVVRAGLTRRPVDPEVVRSAVEVAARPIVGVAEEDAARHETALLTPAEEFRLSRITLGGTGVVAPSPRPPGPQIILCLDGEIEVGVGPRLTHLCSGESTFLGPQARDVVLSGEGVAYRVTTGG